MSIGFHKGEPFQPPHPEEVLQNKTIQLILKMYVFLTFKKSKFHSYSLLRLYTNCIQISVAAFTVGDDAIVMELGHKVTTSSLS